VRRILSLNHLKERGRTGSERELMVMVANDVCLHEQRKRVFLSFIQQSYQSFG
jgi:hypothetical protein